MSREPSSGFNELYETQRRLAHGLERVNMVARDIESAIRLLDDLQSVYVAVMDHASDDVWEAMRAATEVTISKLRQHV